MLTPKSLLTWMIDSFLKPLSMAYLAAATPCSASEVMVRKKMPLVLPSRPSAVSVGEDEAGETWTILAGRAGQFHDEADGDLAVGGMRGTCHRHEGECGGELEYRVSHCCSPLSFIRLRFDLWSLSTFRHLQPGFMQMPPFDAVGRR